jgi:hypothetical protein
MLTVTNEALARRQVRRSNWFLFAAVGVLAAGFALSLIGSDEQTLGVVSLSALLLGIFLWQVSLYFTRRWGARHRQDGALARALKGLDNRYTLVSFAEARLPDYLLVGPHGILILVARAVNGTIRCHRDQWSRAETNPLIAFFLGSPVRNPTIEATQSISQLQRYLQGRLDPADADRVPVTAIVVFTHPQVRLEIGDCRFPVVRARDLRSEVQREKGALGPPQIATLRRLLSPPAEATVR